MGSRLHSTIHLASQSFIDEGAGAVEDWQFMAPGQEYEGYWINLLDSSGYALPWSTSGYAVSLPSFDPDTGLGLTEWYVHLAGALPGIFELARFDDPYAPDSPALVETFEFTDRVIGPLTLVEYRVATDTGPTPYQMWRYWPGNLATLIPT